MNGSGQKLSAKEKMAYGFGDAASNLFWKTFTVFLPNFYTDVFGLTTGAMGTMMLVTRIWDTASDPFFGAFADRTETRWGKFRPFLLWMALPFGFFGVLMFITPNFTPGGKLLYAYVTYTLMMLAYSAINVPYGALMAVISPDSQERTSVASYRFAFAFGGSLVVMLAMNPLLQYLGKGKGHSLQETMQYAYPRAMTVWAVLAALLFVGCFAWTKERVKPLKSQQTTLKKDLKDLFHNAPWLFVVAAGLFTQIMTSLRDGTIVYYFKYYVGTYGTSANACVAHGTGLTYWLTFLLCYVKKYDLLSIFLGTGMICSLVGVMLIPKVTKVLGRKHTYLLLLAAAATLNSLSFWVGPSQLKLMFFWHILINVFTGPTMVIIWAMFADTVDYSEWKTGRRATGLVFSAASMSQKLGWALAGALNGWVLWLFGYQANLAQSTHSLTGIRMMMSFIPATAAIVSFSLACLYPLTEKTIKTMGAELAAKRAAEGSAS
jgi:GPH family glycoside/pentoside/hexuronide:cation symporter